MHAMEKRNGSGGGTNRARNDQESRAGERITPLVDLIEASLLPPPSVSSPLLDSLNRETEMTAGR